MAIQKLEIQHFRNLTDVAIKPKPGLNFIFGLNGSGKTSLLEAIHCLGRGKSFRTHKNNQLINDQSSSFTVVGKIVQKGHAFTIGMQRRKGNSLIRLGGKNVSRASELTESLPLVVLDPGLHRLLEEGPDQRRRFLDWGVFHVEHTFNNIWNNYRRCLVQRNAALKSGWSQQAISHWDKELATAANQLDRIRRDYLSALVTFIHEYAAEFPAIEHIEISYRQGWREGTDYLSYLSEQHQSDKERGFTQYGPHRGDLRISIDGINAVDFLSRGQQKILVASLILAQCQQISSLEKSPVVLVDDLAAELDAETRVKMVKLLEKTQAQVFITATDPILFNVDYESHGVFHVEQGSIKV